MKKKLGDRIKELFTKKPATDDFFEELEDILIEGDIGATETMEVVDSLRERSKKEKVGSKEELQEALKLLLSDYLKAVDLKLSNDEMELFLVLGVNGVGKTTTIAKLAEFYVPETGRKNIVLSAADTFRAAAIDQLKHHAQQLGMRIIAQQYGADPGAVIYDTIESGKAGKTRLVLADTAGRMHNKANLVKELQKIDKIVSKKLERSHYRKILVIDATTGQNGFRQAEIFHDAVGVDAIVLAKYDSTAKGGIAISISRKLGIPFAFLGTGEKYTDLKLFKKEDYLDALLGITS